MTADKMHNQHSAPDSLARICAEIEQSFQAARARAAARLESARHAGTYGTRDRARQLLDESKRHVRRLLGVPDSEPALTRLTDEVGGGLTPLDLHTVDRLLSYVRHSIVRVCFYNLKLFCPSLVDEYDDHVRDQVAANLARLADARVELVRFFAQSLSNGQSIGSVFAEAHARALEPANVLAALGDSAGPRLDDAGVRSDFAARAPGLMDAVMDALQLVQAGLEARRVAVEGLVEQAAVLTKPLAGEAELTLELDLRPTPKVFGDAPRLLNCFIELIANAAKYAGRGATLHVSTAAVNRNGQYAEIAFADSGRGMTADELGSCLTRGGSRGGTGEGLPMVIQTVEADHLGWFEIASEPGKGCRAVVRLPVKLEGGKKPNDGSARD